MSQEEKKEFYALAAKGLKQERSKEESRTLLIGAGIIDKRGNVKNPYKTIFVRK